VRQACAHTGQALHLIGEITDGSATWELVA
jgi:hypothetical protein